MIYYLMHTDLNADNFYRNTYASLQEVYNYLRKNHGKCLH